MNSTVSLIDGHLDDNELSVSGLYKVCKELQNNSARTVKEKILKENIGYEDFKHLLRFLFDNNITTGLDIKKISKDVKSPYTKEDIGQFHIIELLDFVKEYNTGSNDVIGYVQTYIDALSNDEDEMDFLYEIVTKSLRLGIDAKTVNKVFGYEFIPTFNVQLGTSIEDVKLNGDEQIFISQKLNGTRCVYYNGELWTRNGKKYTGCQHIVDDIKRLCIEDLLCNPRDKVFDGELVLKKCGLSDSEAFQKGTGIAISKNAIKEELEYVIFDTMTKKEFEKKVSTIKYSARKSYLESLRESFNRLGISNLRIVPFFYQGCEHNKIWEYLDYAENNDMEGIIVNLDTPYEFKRTKNLIKVKAFHDIDLECVAIEQGEKGKYKNTLGAIVCKYKDGLVRVGSGFSEELRDYYFNHQDEIIGKIISVKYKEATKNKNGSESLQFPVFLCVREDKDIADV